MRINLTPNLAQATAPQIVELCTHHFDPHVQGGELGASGLLLPKHGRNAIGVVERRRKLGNPLRPGARDSL